MIFTGRANCFDEFGDDNGDKRRDSDDIGTFKNDQF
jgi:hypothetical protein